MKVAAAAFVFFLLSTIWIAAPSYGQTASTGALTVTVGPGQFNWDMAFTKKTVVGGIGENAYLEFRAEFFNAFNHPPFSNPVTNDASGAFGVISSTSVGPRIIQFGLKYVF